VSARRILVTGGSGFIGSALVKALLRRGEAVRVFDDNSRGALRRLREVEREVEFVHGDIRDAAAVEAAMHGVDEVHHLAFVNGTATFYSAPDLVLDVGVKGIVNVIDGYRHHGVGRLILASSSEVYQSPPRVPTDERVSLVVPDPLNPRLFYGAGKIISEMMAINHGRKHFERVLISAQRRGSDMRNFSLMWTSRSGCLGISATTGLGLGQLLPSNEKRKRSSSVHVAARVAVDVVR
jgi:nucleoside-diphosphate-sugar epimerase